MRARSPALFTRGLPFGKPPILAALNLPLFQLFGKNLANGRIGHQIRLEVVRKNLYLEQIPGR